MHTLTRLHRLFHRDCPDDGAVTSLLFVPLVAATLLHVSLVHANDQLNTASSIPRHWLISLSRLLPDSPHHPSFTRIQSLILARRNLVHLSTLCSFVLFCHMAASRWSRWRSGCRSQGGVPSHDLRPKAEGRRNFLYTQFSLGIVALVLALRNMSEVLDAGFWQGGISRSSFVIYPLMRARLRRLDIPRHRPHLLRVSIHHLRNGPTCPPWIHLR